MKLVIDTREQRPYRFDRWPEISTERAGLPTGDYSVEGYEDRVAVERKSLGDLLGCLCGGRRRFERELERAGTLECFAVVVEASISEVHTGKYRSMIKPHAAMQSVVAFQVKYATPFLWANDRDIAEYVTFSFLEKFYRYKTEATDAT